MSLINSYIEFLREELLFNKLMYLQIFNYDINNKIKILTIKLLLLGESIENIILKIQEKIDTKSLIDKDEMKYGDIKRFYQFVEEYNFINLSKFIIDFLSQNISICYKIDIMFIILKYRINTNIMEMIKSRYDKQFKLFRIIDEFSFLSF